jgi:regulator of nucleoside diphosphate kinase
MLRGKVLISRSDHERIRELLNCESVTSIADAQSIATLRRRIEQSNVVKDQAVPPNVITMGSTVVLREPTTNEDERFTLVYPQQADIAEGKLSVMAPLGIALLGQRVGQSVCVPIPSGQRTFVIQKLISQADQAIALPVLQDLNAPRALDDRLR